MTTKAACLNLLKEFWAGNLTAKELERRCKDLESKQLVIPVKAVSTEFSGTKQMLKEGEMV